MSLHEFEDVFLDAIRTNNIERAKKILDALEGIHD